MKKLILFSIILGISIISYSQNIEKEKEEIKRIIQTAYVEGLQNEGDEKKIDEGIHPDFVLLGIGEDGKMWKYPISEWKIKTVEKLKNEELPREENKKVSVVFKQVDVTGTAAMVKLEFYVGKELKYIDYISLYKFESGWKMVNKIFYKI